MDRDAQQLLIFSTVDDTDIMLEGKSKRDYHANL